MIDTLLANRHRFKKPKIWDEICLEKGNYLVITLHRPNTVDNAMQLKSVIEAIARSSRSIPLIFPVHPRTAKVIKSFNLKFPESTHFTEPLGYLEFNYLVENSKAVITDSGGITEETTIMGIPCITLRNNTERPETIMIGTNELIGTNPEAIKPALDKLFTGKWKRGGIPEKWDGNATERIVEILSHIII